MSDSRFNEQGLLIEQPVGICPACGEAVYVSLEGDYGPVWTCPYNLTEGHAFYREFPQEHLDVLSVLQKRKGDYSRCPADHRLFVPDDDGHMHDEDTDHLPLHSKCYNGQRVY